MVEKDEQSTAMLCYVKLTQPIPYAHTHTGSGSKPSLHITHPFSQEVLELVTFLCAKSMHIKKERGNYHKLRTSSDFKLECKKFLEAAIKTISVHFYQHITHTIFLELLYLESFRSRDG